MKLKRYNQFLESKSDMWDIIPQSVKDLHKLFQSAGKKLYLVGGSVRDFLTGDKPKDFDLATNALPDEVLEIIGDKLTYWLGSFWLNISRAIEPSEEPIRFKPEGNGYFEEYEGNWYLSNRASAMRFKDSLYRIFSGDIIVRETSQIPGGMKEEVIDQLCNVREHDIDEYEDIMNSIKNIRINQLYKD